DTLAQVGGEHVGQAGVVDPPREAGPGDRGRVVEPGVPAEDLVGRLAGQGHRGPAGNGLEQQVQGGVQVAEAGQVPGAGGDVLDPQQIRRIEQHVGVAAAEVVDEGFDVRGVAVGPVAVGDEIPGAVLEIDGEGDEVALVGQRVTGQGGH